MENEKLAHLLNYDEWQSRLSGSIIPFAVDDAVPPQDPGLPSGASATAAVAPQEPGLPSGSFASVAAAALPGEDSEYEEATTEPTITGRWVKRAGQTNWRVCGVHMHHKHANDRRQHGRDTAADVVGIALRENVMRSQATGTNQEDILRKSLARLSNYMKNKITLPPIL